MYKLTIILQTFRTQFEIDLNQENKLRQEPTGYRAGNNLITN